MGFFKLKLQLSFSLLFSLLMLTARPIYGAGFCQVLFNRRIYTAPIKFLQNKISILAKKSTIQVEEEEDENLSATILNHMTEHQTAFIYDRRQNVWEVNLYDNGNRVYLDKITLSVEERYSERDMDIQKFKKLVNTKVFQQIENPKSMNAALIAKLKNGEKVYVMDSADQLHSLIRQEDGQIKKISEVDSTERLMALDYLEKLLDSYRYRPAAEGYQVINSSWENRKVTVLNNDGQRIVIPYKTFYNSYDVQQTIKEEKIRTQNDY